jgi:hypothetical protein
VKVVAHYITAPRAATACSPEVVVTGTIGSRGMAQRQRGRREDGDGRRGIALTGQDVEDDVSGVDAVGDGLAAGRLSSVSTAVRM